MFQCFFLKCFSEAVAQRCSVKNVFLEISQNSQESRTPLVAACFFKTSINITPIFLYSYYPLYCFFFWVFDLFWKYPLRARCSNTEFFLVRIFPYSDWMRENTGQKKLRIWTLFTQWLYCELRFFWSCLSKVKTLFSVSIRLQRNCSNCLEYFSLHKLPDF